MCSYFIPKEEYCLLVLYSINTLVHILKEIHTQKLSDENACLSINTFICSGGFKYAEGTRSVDAMLPFTHTIFRVSQRNKSVNQLR